MLQGRKTKENKLGCSNCRSKSFTRDIEFPFFSQQIFSKQNVDHVGILTQQCHQTRYYDVDVLRLISSDYANEATFHKIINYDIKTKFIYQHA